MNKKIIHGVDYVLILASVFVVLWIIGFSNPQVIAPSNNYETFNRTVLFTIENGEKLLVSQDINFTEAKEYELNKNLSLNLKPGIYFWKVIGIRESEIRTFTIKDSVILNVVKSEDGYDIVNAGSVNLNVEVYNNRSEFLENLTLVPEEQTKLHSNKYIGAQDG